VINENTFSKGDVFLSFLIIEYTPYIMLQTPQQFFIGIDEVGRGPLAGPVAVGAVAATQEMIERFRDIRESKQLSAKKREEWSARIHAEAGDDLRIAVGFISATMIDKIGIASAIRRALGEAIGKLGVDPKEARVLLDGGLKAPLEYEDQQTIIRGDVSETVIAMASVVAKVDRDRRMIALATQYPGYGFASHVGYGTKAHIAAIKEQGFTPEHRRSFCRNIVVS
jgi:ribonuclease HII